MPPRLLNLALVCFSLSSLLLASDRIHAQPARSQLPAAQTAAIAGLKIVVIAGEDSVNIIQQKTAVAPIVEVRDRNDLPVGGAIVTFTVSGNQATFAGGVRTLTIATDSAGRAAVGGLNPVSSGGFQVNISASYKARWPRHRLHRPTL